MQEGIIDFYRQPQMGGGMPVFTGSIKAEVDSSALWRDLHYLYWEKLEKER